MVGMMISSVRSRSSAFRTSCQLDVEVREEGTYHRESILRKAFRRDAGFPSTDVLRIEIVQHLEVE